ncbi:MauE/DoxX family redox-associated membrane protein [Rubrobacter calidifluminis]|uniref:MauE/DoxX family redox-associated membrane protein n=1 Tax=Rubrobacter calidifluminis TaxID=1392640 RepID=UPI00235FCE24|nr:MauE/DoxX family redox-associated membrane protein [Rubrobacter calidifluminis]
MEMAELGAYAARFFLAAVFVAAGLSKLFRSAEFERAVENYRLLPAGWSRTVAFWLPEAELLAGIFLAFGVLLVPAASVVGLMLLVFSGAVAINLLRGREMGCGCFGAGSPEKMTWLTVVRNLLLFGLALVVVFVPPAALAVWAGPGAGSAIAVQDASVIAMLIFSTSAALLLALLEEGWRVAKSFRRLAQRSTSEFRQEGNS